MRWLILWRVFQERKAVVALFKGQENVGNISFVQEQEGGVVKLSGVVSGLAIGKHGFHIHEKGNIDKECTAAGAHFNPEQVGCSSTNRKYFAWLIAVTRLATKSAELNT
jgi:Cu/Zn superoxide dismutase